MAAAGTVLGTSTAAELEAGPAVEDVDTIRVDTVADPFVTVAVIVAAAAAIPVPLVAVADMLLSFPTKDADVIVALVPLTGPNPAIASS